MVIDESSVQDRLRPYLPRLTLEWLASDPGSRHRAVDGSVVFVDISGFTKLSEKLARFGRVGAEEMADSINLCFAELLALAYEGNGSLLKFGGDALLLLFTGDSTDEHAVQAARAAHRMRARLRTVGKLETTGGKVNLRMSVGVHSGRFDFFLVGDSHRELLVTGPATTEVVRMEGTADAGEIVISPALAAHLPSRCIGDPKGPGSFLRAAPPGDAHGAPWLVPDAMSDELLRTSVSVATREHLLGGATEPEHRHATVAFLHFDGTDEMIRDEGPERTADELHRLVSDTQEAVDAYGVCFLGSDADADGGKLILVAGAPRAMGEDEERMLLALRRVAEGDRRIAVRIGVNQGSVFAGDVGPAYRRTYTVMGDTVNLAARLMAKAPPGEIFATGSVLDRSATRFSLTELEPFTVKGKAKPIHAWSVGEPVSSRTQDVAVGDHPLVGREAEVAALAAALSEVRAGHGRLVELVGESGVGKSRLVHELVGAASDLELVSATGEAYTQSTPYVAWRDVLRTLLGVGWEAPSEQVADRLTEVVRDADPSLLPWAPLIARAADADMPLTPEVRDLGPDFVRAKLHEAVVSFLRATRTEPTVFVFEDAHLMDEPSADLLAAVSTAQPADRPWLVVAVRRDAGSGFVAPDAENLVRLAVGPLDPTSARMLGEAASEETPVPGHVLELAIERAAGNPQLLLDLIATAATGDGTLPDSVEAAATVRLDALDRGDRLLLRRASVLGLAFHPRFLVDVLDEGTPPPDDSTWARLGEFIEEEGGGYLRFRRAVLREAAYAGLPFRLRRRLHGAVGSRMERELPDPEGEAGILSLHFFIAGELRKSWHFSLTAGRRAQEIFANVEASRFYRRAVEAGRKVGVPRDELLGVLEARGEVLWLARLYEEALRVNADARAICRDDPVRLARLMLRRSTIEERLGRLPQGLRWLSKARRVLEDATSNEALQVAAELDARYASGLQVQGRNREAMRIAQRAIEEGEAAGSRAALGDAENSLAATLAILGEPGAVEHWRRALEHFEASNDLPGQSMVLGNLGVGAYFEGRWDEAVDRYTRALELSERTGDPVSAANDRINIAEVLVDQGDLAEADRLLRRTVRVWRSTDDHYLYGFTLLQLGRIAAMLGRIDEARTSFVRAREEYVAAGAPGQVLEVETREAECALLDGDAADALTRCDRIQPRLEATEGVHVLVPVLDRIRGYACMQLGDLDRARAWLEQALEGAQERGADHDVALTLQALARLSRRQGTPSSDVEDESGRILARLGIAAVPAVPLNSSGHGPIER